MLIGGDRLGTRMQCALKHTVKGPINSVLMTRTEVEMAKAEKAGLANESAVIVAARRWAMRK
jgi:hypothetical protein